MATLEQVERLREKADVSYDEARAALDAANGDLLDALILLERQGKTRTPGTGGQTSTRTEQTGTAPGAESGTGAGAGPGGSYYTRHQGESFGDLMRRFGRFCLRVLRLGNANSFEVEHRGTVKASVPVTVLVLLGVFAFWITLPLMVIGLFFGLRYRFVGPNIQAENPVNSTIDTAANAAENLKKSLAEEERNNKE